MLGLIFPSSHSFIIIYFKKLFPSYKDHGINVAHTPRNTLEEEKLPGDQKAPLPEGRPHGPQMGTPGGGEKVGGTGRAGEFPFRLQLKPSQPQGRPGEGKGASCPPRVP